jgi:hypothetical protein
LGNTRALQQQRPVDHITALFPVMQKAANPDIRISSFSS